jgi:hypothetical protein
LTHLRLPSESLSGSAIFRPPACAGCFLLAIPPISFRLHLGLRSPRFSMRPFTLRRRKLAFRPVPAAKSMFPAYIFKTIRETFTRPVRSHAPAPVWPFIASRDAFTARNPLLSSASRFSVCLRAAAPPQDLSIPRVRSTQLDSNRRSLPLRVARSSFAPHSAKILSRRETDHRSRSATSRQARYPPRLMILSILRTGHPLVFQH